MKRLWQHPIDSGPMAAVRELLAQFDRNDDGALTFAEFGAMVRQREPDVTHTEEELEQRFANLDFNQDGMVDGKEVLRSTLVEQLAKLQSRAKPVAFAFCDVGSPAALNGVTDIENPDIGQYDKLPARHCLFICQYLSTRRIGYWQHLSI